MPDASPTPLNDLPADRLHRIRAAAERLALSERAVWALVQTGALACVRIGRSTRIRESDLQRIIRKGLPGEEDRR